MSRRSGSEQRQRTIALATRWSPEEYDMLNSIADYSGVSRAEVLRQLVARDHRNLIPSRDLTREVRRLGNNANQLARAVNAGKPLAFNALNQLYAEMLAVLIEMRR